MKVIVRVNADSSEPARDGPPPSQRVIHTPESPLRHPGVLIGDILRDVWLHQELTWILFQRDLKAQFRQSMLGYFWLVIPPLANALVWYLLNSQRLITVDTGEVPYPVFVLIGSTLWTSFTMTLMSPSDVISQNREVFIKLNVPLESFILAGAAKAVFNLTITSAIILPVLLLQGISLHWTAIFFPLSAMMFLTLAFAVGMCIAPIGALYTDFRNAIAPLFAVLMFTVPVVYPIPNQPGVITSVLANNPATPSLSLARDNLVSGDVVWLGPTLLWFLASLLVLMVTFVGLRVAKPHIISRLGM